MVSSGAARVSLPTEEQILITGEFAVQRHIVYKAWTTPELVKRWWTADRGEPTLVEIDLRVGGSWRYLMTLDDGTEVGFRGEFLEIDPDARLVFTEVDESRPNTPAVKRLTLAETFGADGPLTTLTLLVTHATREDRDAYLRTMNDGLQDAMYALDRVCRSLAGSD